MVSRMTQTSEVQSDETGLLFINHTSNEIRRMQEGERFDFTQIFRAPASFESKVGELMKKYPELYPNKSIVIRAGVNLLYKNKIGKREVQDDDGAFQG